ncbi:hypothetical protein AB4Z45_12545 [Paenibacillus sp. MCAF9]|uniref:hypothetical protein n=1 Tax=Paenibacillus sp. MCAF9 TaxID=3233046 RepID=UPI003F9D5DD6
MKFNISIDERYLFDWLTSRIQEDVLEKYGIKIIITQMDESNEETAMESQFISSNSLPKQDSETLDRFKLPEVLEPAHIQQILGIGRRATYELLNDPPFHVNRVGKNKMMKVPRDVFFRWLDGK